MASSTPRPFEQHTTSPGIQDYTAFKYSALTSSTITRLLKIWMDGGHLRSTTAIYDGFNSDDVIVCELDPVDLRDDPPYDALSYTWSNPSSVFRSKEDAEKADGLYASTKVPIICNNMIMYVGVNLHDALVYLRKGRRRKDYLLQALHRDLPPRSAVQMNVWIDAICINQSDVSERNTQVQIMDKIYRQAEVVHIWLGPEDCFTRPAISVIRLLGELPAESAKDFILSNELHSDQYSSLGLPYISPFHWMSLFAFFERRWFRRAWILQEVALSKIAIVICGSISFPWVGLVSAALWLRESRAYPTIWRKSLRNSVELFSGFTQLYIDPHSSNFHAINTDANPISTLLHITDVRAGLGIGDATGLGCSPRAKKVDQLSLLTRFSSAQCQDPHDKIYAFLILMPLNSEGKKLVEVDYAQDVAEVYTNSSRAIAESNGSLRHLSLVRDSMQESIQDLPSWAIDWRRGFFSTFETRLCFEDVVDGVKAESSYCACAGEVWEPYRNENANPRHLQVRGKQIGVVQNVAKIKKGDLKQLLPVYNDIPPVYTSFTVSDWTEHDQQNHPTTETMPQELMDRLKSLTIKKEPKEAQQITKSSSKEAPDPRLVVKPKRVIDIYEQTRFEALWRTLIGDVWNRQHPAPPEAGFAFADSIIEDMHDLLARAQTALDKDGIAEGRQDWVQYFHHFIDAALDYGGDVSFERIDADWRRRMVNLIVFAEDEGKCAQLLSGDVEKSTLYLPKITSSEDVLEYSVRDVAAVQTWNTSAQIGGNVLFSTSLHQLGLGPPSTTIGDEVWILAGAKFPYILRRLQNGHHVVVQEAYVHGIMHGEAVWFDSDGAFTELTLE